MTRTEANLISETITNELSKRFGPTDAQIADRERAERKRLKEAKRQAKVEKRFSEHEDRVFGSLCGLPVRVRG